MIRDAFMELMEEKGFEGITVNELTAKADINRGTFYLHYRDKHDLLEQSKDEIVKEINEIVKVVQRISPEEALNYNSQYEPFSFIVKLFECISENYSFIKVMLGPKGDPSFQVKLKEVLKENILKKLLHQSKKEEIMVPSDYLIAYVSSAYLGVIQHWLESGMKESSRDMALVLLKINVLGPGTVAGFLKTSKSK
jgi:AcrR family transcriptional regulator